MTSVLNSTLKVTPRLPGFIIFSQFSIFYHWKRLKINQNLMAAVNHLSATELKWPLQNKCAFALTFIWVIKRHDRTVCWDCMQCIMWPKLGPFYLTLVRGLCSKSPPRMRRHGQRGPHFTLDGPHPLRGHFYHLPPRRTLLPMAMYAVSFTGWQISPVTGLTDYTYRTVHPIWNLKIDLESL